MSDRCPALSRARLLALRPGQAVWLGNRCVWTRCPGVASKDPGQSLTEFPNGTYAVVVGRPRLYVWRAPYSSDFGGSTCERTWVVPVMTKQGVVWPEGREVAWALGVVPAEGGDWGT